MTTEYGTDIACLNDLDPLFRVISGPQVLSEAIARRFITPRGALLSDLNYGLDLRIFLSESLTSQKLFAIASSVEAEITKDERITSASATVTYNASTRELLIEIAAETTDNDLSLVLSVSKLNVAILKAA